MTDKPKQYRLKEPITIAFVDDDNHKIVLRTASNELLFISPEMFLADFKEFKDE